MKTKTETYPEIGKTVIFDLEKHKHNAFLLFGFEVHAHENGWTEAEIKKVCDYLKGKPYDQQLHVLGHYCQQPVVNVHGMNQADVRFLLAHLRSETHYLSSKPIDTWDEYDWSNYRSLERKATSRVRRVYAYFSDSVEERYKYEVTSPPALYFNTREEAESKLSETTLKTTNIYPLWIRETP